MRTGETDVGVSEDEGKTLFLDRYVPYQEDPREKPHTDGLLSHVGVQENQSAIQIIPVEICSWGHEPPI